VMCYSELEYTQLLMRRLTSDLNEEPTCCRQ
jgi:hypothetical protein